MTTKRTPQTVSPLASWLSYLESLHSKTVDLDLEYVSQVAAHLGVLKSTPFVFTAASTSGGGTTCRTLEPVLVAVGYKVDVYSSPHPVCYTERVRVQDQELPKSTHATSFMEIGSARSDISPAYFEYGILSALWLFKQAQPDIVTLGVGLGSRLDATDIVGAGVAVVTSIVLDHTGWLEPDRESIGRERADIFHNEKPAIVGEPEIPFAIADVAQEEGTLLQRRGTEWNYPATDHDQAFSNVHGTPGNLSLPPVPRPNVATALAVLHANRLEVSENAIRDGIASAVLPGRFQIVGESPHVIFGAVHNLYAAEYLTERTKVLPRNGRVLTIIDMLHGKDTTGILAWLKSVANDWCCVPPEGPRGATVEQLLRHLDNGRSFDSVAQAWGAAMVDTKVEDIVLICSSFRTVTYVMEMVDTRRSGGK